MFVTRIRGVRIEAPTLAEFMAQLYKSEGEERDDRHQN